MRTQTPTLVHPARRVAVAMSVALAAAAFGVFWTTHAHAAQPTGEPPIPRGAPISSWFQNGSGGIIVLQVVEGSGLAPGARLSGTVTTDTTCDPDAQGLSHCHNAIDLDNGTRITVLHTHPMMRYPCLKPGERVTLTGFAPNWVTATVLGA